MITKELEYEVCKGESFRVEFYYERGGNMPAYKYYQQLSEDDRARFFAMVSYIANAPIGTIHPKTIYNIEDTKNRIFALKPYQHRFFNFQTADRRIILTNAYKKESDRMDKAGRNVLKAAIRIKSDYLARQKEGTYYEKE